MVEGHQCHRVAAAHRKLLVGHAFKASSPNGRFTEGAAMIDRRPLTKIEVHGKNLFYFFSRAADSGAAEPVATPPAAAHSVVHIHFGMSGAFKTMRREEAPKPAATTRLRLESDDLDLIAHLSAMTVDHGDDAFYQEKIAKLGPDPLREDADAERLWETVQASKKPIGLVLMDQSMVAGLGNIYRAEVLFKARVHPEQPANTVTREEFDRIWRHSVLLLQRGFLTGSILTVDDEDAEKMGPPWTRRYIYNHSSCGMCSGRVRTWDMATRPVLRGSDKLTQARRDAMAAASDAKEFVSHCATDGGDTVTPSKMTVAQLRAALLNGGAQTPLPKNKTGLVAALEALKSGAGPEAAAAAAAAAVGAPAPPKRLAKTPKAMAGTGMGKAAQRTAAAAAAAAATAAEEGDDTTTMISTCSDETQDVAPAARAAAAVKEEEKDETVSASLEPEGAGKMEVDVKPGIAGIDASSIDWQNPLSMTPRASAAAAQAAGPFDDKAGVKGADDSAEPSPSDAATATEVAVGATVARTPKKRRGAAAEATPDSKRPRQRNRGKAAAAKKAAAARTAAAGGGGGGGGTEGSKPSDAAEAAADGPGPDSPAAAPKAGAAAAAAAPPPVVPGIAALGDVATASAAAQEKVVAGENRAVEHVAMGDGDLAGNLLSQKAPAVKP